VLLAAGNLASGSPPAQEIPIAIAPAESSVAATIPIAFDVQPGRPGPNRFGASLPAALPAGSRVELRLLRLDASTGETRIALHPVDTGSGTASTTRFAADGGLLQAQSRWDASVVVAGADGREVARQRFTFTLDDASISEGRQVPPVDPVLVVAIVLLLLAVLGISYTLGGGSLPRVNPASSRTAVLAGGVVAGALGLVLLLGGARL
jgi:hypothetical protein